MDFFKKQVDEGIDAQISFLKNHFRYYTANSWNRMTSYANCVKLHKLDIPAGLQKKAWDFLTAECDDYNLDISSAIHDFYDETGYWAGFNGRSDGYIVMYDTEIKNEGLYVRYTSIDDGEDFKDWAEDELSERVSLVQRFDQLCDEIRDIFLYYAENAIVQEEEYTVRRTHIVAHLAENV